MRTITFASQKGGTGKSTLAIGLAVAAVADGEQVFILETDLQGTISKWRARRSNLEPVVEQIASRFQLERELRNVERRGGTLAIIDTPGNDSEIVTEAIRLCDLCLIPARPSQADIEATHPTLKAISRFDRGFAFVLNQAPVRGQRPTRAATALNEVGMLAFPYIVLRNDHMDSLAAGLGVTEFAPEGIAAAEIRTLLAWSKQILTGDSPAAKLAPEHAPLEATETVMVKTVDDNPLQSMVLRSLRLAAFPWVPWLRPYRTGFPERGDDQPRT